ncbi:hypothetical protein CEXT_399701, partial [Caerostris extrusa]
MMMSCSSARIKFIAEEAFLLPQLGLNFLVPPLFRINTHMSGTRRERIHNIPFPSTFSFLGDCCVDKRSGVLVPQAS